jgi:DNA replication protein DnaC
MRRPGQAPRRPPHPRRRGFVRGKRIEEFDFEANSSISPAVIHQLATCAWVRAGHPLCLIGDSGTGKISPAHRPGHRRCEGRYRVRYTLASKLVNELAEAADDRQLSKTIARQDLAARRVTSTSASTPTPP